MPAWCGRERTLSDSTTSVRRREPPRAAERRYQCRTLGRPARACPTVPVLCSVSLWAEGRQGRPAHSVHRHGRCWSSYRSRGRQPRPRREDAEARQVRCAQVRRRNSARFSPVRAACLGCSTTSARPEMMLASRSRLEPVWSQARRAMTMWCPGTRRRQVSGQGRRTLNAMSWVQIRLESRSRTSDRAIREPGTDTGRAAPRPPVLDADNPQAPLLSTSIASASTSMYFCRLSRGNCMISRSLQW